MAKQDEANFPLSSKVEKKSLQILMATMEQKGSKFLSDDANAWQKQIEWMSKQHMITTKPQPNDLFVELMK